MNNLFDYTEALRDTIANHQEDIQKQAEKDSEFNTQIQEALTPFTTEFLREGVPPLVQKLGLGISKKLGLDVKTASRIAKNLKEGGVPKAISGEIQERFNRSGPRDETPENPGEAPDQTPIRPIREVEFQNPVFDPESSFEPEEFEPEEAEGNPSNLYSFREILRNKDLFKQYAKNTVPENIPDTATDEDFENARMYMINNGDQLSEADLNRVSFIEPAEPQPGTSSNQIGRLLRQGSPQEPSPETPEPTVSEEPSPSIPTTESDLTEAGENLAKNTAKTAIEDVGENIGEDLGEATLDADPITAPLGIILGIGSLLGEIFGQKHPVLPQTMTQPSTQFGV